MMRNTFRITSLLLVFCASSAVFGQANKPRIDFGAIEGSTYTHSYFGMKLTIPNQWQVQDDEAKKRIAAVGKQAVAGDNKLLGATVDAALLNTLNLLILFQHPLGTPVDHNPSFMCVAEKVSHLPGIKSPKDYLFSAKKFMQMSQAEYVFAGETYSEAVAGKDFAVMPVTITLGKLSVKQKYYSTLAKGYALNFVLSYTTDEELKLLEGILHSITFQQ